MPIQKSRKIRKIFPVKASSPARLSPGFLTSYAQLKFGPKTGKTGFPVNTRKILIRETQLFFGQLFVVVLPGWTRKPVSHICLTSFTWNWWRGWQFGGLVFEYHLQTSSVRYWIRFLLFEWGSHTVVGVKYELIYIDLWFLTSAHQPYSLLTLWVLNFNLIL